MYLQDPKQNIEIASDVPKLDALIGEVNEALADMSGYFVSCQDSYDFWHSRWPGQTMDGRKHSYSTGDEAWPWENASDTTVRLGEHFVDQYVGLKQRVFMQSRWQATALRPMTPSGRESNQVATLLKWMIYTHMRSEVLREIPLAFAWQGGYGASAVRCGWRQEQRVEEHEFSLQILEEFVGQQVQQGQQQGQQPNPVASALQQQLMQHLLQAIQDPGQEDQMIALLQQLSPLVTKTIAGQALDALRAGETTTLPVPFTYENKPTWTARRFGVDLVIPVGTRDLQQARFVGECEWVSETELNNRIQTEDYEPKFVAELLKHRGEAENESWIALGAGERSIYSRGGFIGRPWPSFEFRNLFQLMHVHYKATDDSNNYTDCYTTVLAPSMLREKGATKQLFAKHGVSPYEHGKYPFIPFRYETKDSAILSSQSIPRKVHTWEDEIKTQRDGRTDMTALVLRPPIIVPYSRQGMLDGHALPGSKLALTRSDLVRWMDPPQQPTMSVEIEQNNMAWAREFMGLFGGEDKEWQQICRSNLTDQTVSEMIMLGDMTLDLLRQYEQDSEVQDVVGPLQRPFNVDKQTLAQKHYLQIAFDSRMLNEDGVEQIAKVVGALLPFDRSGATDMAGLYKSFMQMAVPDIADNFIQDQEPSAQRETNDQQDMITAAMAGIEKPVPAHGNFQLRLQVLSQTLQNPQIQAELKTKPISQQILQKQAQYYENQIQQYQVNPQIGRTLATSALQPKQALPTTTMSGALQ